MGCTQSVKIIPQRSSEPDIVNTTNTTNTADTQVCAYAVSAKMIQCAYKAGFDDYESIFSANTSYGSFTDSQEYYNDGYMAGLSSSNAEKILGYSKLDAEQFYDNNYGNKVMRRICGYYYMDENCD